MSQSQSHLFCVVRMTNILSREKIKIYTSLSEGSVLHSLPPNISFRLRQRFFEGSRWRDKVGCSISDYMIAQTLGLSCKSFRGGLLSLQEQHPGTTGAPLPRRPGGGLQEAVQTQVASPSHAPGVTGTRGFSEDAEVGVRRTEPGFMPEGRQELQGEERPQHHTGWAKTEGTLK